MAFIRRPTILPPVHTAQKSSIVPIYPYKIKLNMACNYKDTYSGLCVLLPPLTVLSLYSHLSQIAFSVTGDLTFGHTFLSPSLPPSSGLSSTSLSMKPFLIVLTRSHPISHGLKSYATPSWHLLHLMPHQYL